MTLYHGTNADIGSIDLTRDLRHKDFGKGFYLTPNRTTAIRMAQKKARLFGGTPTLITYGMDDAALRNLTHSSGHGGVLSGMSGTTLNSKLSPLNSTPPIT